MNIELSGEWLSFDELADIGERENQLLEAIESIERGVTLASVLFDQLIARGVVVGTDLEQAIASWQQHHRPRV